MSTITIKNESMAAVIATIKPLVKKGVNVAFVLGTSQAGENVSCQLRIISENGTEQIDKGFYALKPSGFEQGKIYMRVNLPADTFVTVAETLLAFNDGITFSLTENGFTLSTKGVSEVAIPMVADDELTPEIAMDSSSVLFSFTGDSSKVASAIKKGAYLSEDCEDTLQNTVPFLFGGSDRNCLTITSTNKGALAVASVDVSTKMIASETSDETDKNADGSTILDTFMKEKGMSQAMFPIPAAVISTLITVIRLASKFEAYIGQKHVKVKTPGIIYTFTLGASCTDGIVNLVNMMNKMVPENVMTVDNDAVIKGIAVCGLNGGKYVDLSLCCAEKALLLETSMSKTRIESSECSGIDHSVRLNLNFFRKAVNIYPKGNLTISQLMAAQKDSSYITVVRADSEAECTYIMPINNVQPQNEEEDSAEE